ncbi:MAG: hypothetical protein AB8B96_06100 [Lysobacterales bacterium]
MTIGITVGFAALLVAIAATLLALKYRKDAETQHTQLSSALAQARVQADHTRQELKALSKLMRRQIGEGAEHKQRQQAMASRLAVMESLEAGQQALATAKTRLADGQSLRPLIQRGAINASEAHLLSLVHRQSSVAAHG